MPHILISPTFSWDCPFNFLCVSWFKMCDVHKQKIRGGKQKLWCGSKPICYKSGSGATILLRVLDPDPDPYAWLAMHKVKMFCGVFFIKSQNCYRIMLYCIDWRLISQQFVHCWKLCAIFVQNTLCFAELQRNFLPVQIRAQTRYRICAFFIHRGLFLSTQGTSGEHQ
jgi:hypothetical protein